MHFRLRDWFLVAGLLLTVHSQVSAQTIDYEVLLDLDLNPGTGCTVTPAGGTPINGIDARARATVDSGLLQVVALETEQCSGAAFSAPVPVADVTVPYPVATNVGTGGGDAVELAASRNALGADGAALIGLTFTGDNGAGSDELATVDGQGGGPILFGLPVQIPALSMIGLIFLIGALLVVAALAHRRMGRVGSVMAVMLVATAAWAMTFIIDGDIADWTGVGPIAQDPGGDSTDGSASADILAAFAALDGDRLVFRIDVADLENQAPVANDDAFSVDEDASLNEPAPGVLANDTDGDMDPLTATLVTGPTNAQAFTLNADGSFNYTPAADFSGSDSFTYVANDGQVDSAPATVTITVNPINDPPVAVDDTAVTNEDVQVDVDVLANDSDVDGNLDPASVAVTTPPTSGSTSVNPANGVITYTKSADFNGADSFVYEVCDDGTPLPAQCDTATVNITINDVNDAPTFTAGPDQTVNEDAGAQTVAGWATAISPGAPNEAGQTLTFNFTGNTNAALFAAGPAVDATTGDLTFTPAADTSGSANLTIELMDDGGTANGGVDTSAPASFTITVNPVNDAPTFTPGADVTVLEDSGAYDQPWATGISAGPADESGQTLTFNITANDNPGLFAAGPTINAGSGNLSFTPAAEASGVANLTVELMDDGGTANGGVDTSAPVNLVITVTNINDAPSFTAGPDPTVDEDSGAQTVNGWATGISAGAPNETGQTLTFNITGNTDPGLFSAGPSVDSTTGNLSFTPAANAYGSATITLTLMDDGGTANGGVDTSPPASFTITVNPINDPPSAPTTASFDVTTHIRINVPAGSGLLVGAADEATEAADPAGPASPGTNLTVGNGGNPAPTTTANGGDLSINTTDGSFNYNPPAGFTGSDSFSYVVCDDGIGAPGPQCSAPVNVTLNVAGPRVWFVDNALSGGGNDGRLASPFESLAAFNGSILPAAGDFIFLATGSGVYSDGANAITLADNQTLFGHGTTGTTFDAFTGITPAPNSLARPTLGAARPVIEAATNGILVSTSGGNSNTLRGFNIGNTPGGTGITGTIPGTLNISELDITGTGGLISLDGSSTGTLNASFGSLSSTSAATTNAFEVMNMAGGSLTSASTTITTPGQNAISIAETPTMSHDFGDLATILTAAGAGIVTTNPGTVTISPPAPVTIQTIGGPALNLSGGTYNGFNFSSLSANNTVNGIVLTNTAGFISCGGGNIQNTTGDAVVITGGSNSITLGTFITNSAGRAVEVTGHTGGNVVFNQITDTAQGVFLDNNPGTTFFFAGTMNLNTGANDAFTATGGGSLDATGASNVIATTTGRAVNIDSVSIRATGFTVQSVTSVGGVNPGIFLNNTGTTGNFEITGDGTTNNNASGGTISAKSGNAIQLNSTGPVIIDQMDIGAVGALSNIAEIGLRAESVNGLTVRNSNFINASGDDAGGGNDFAAIRVLFPIAGSNINLTGNLFQRSFEDHVRIENGNGSIGGGVALNTVSITQNMFDDNDASGQGNDAFLYVGNNGSAATITVEGNDFFNSDGDHIQVALNGTASADLTIGGASVGAANMLTSNGAGNVLGSGITISSGQGAGGANFSGNLTYLIQGNNIQDPVAAAINVNLSPSSTAGVRYSGTIDGNIIGTSGDAFSGGFGITATQNGAGTLNATISNNTIVQYDGDHGMLLQARDGSGRLNAEVTGNTISEPADAFVFDGLGINAGAISTDTSTVCADVRNNTLTGSSGASSGGADFLVATTSGAPAGPTVILPGYGGTAKDAGAIVSFVQSQNVGMPSGAAFFSANSVGVLGTGSSCL